jgi:Fe2+ transport system protein FeoA
MTEYPLPVTAFAVGQTVRLCFMGLDDDTATRLRAVGVREGCDACVVATGDKCVLGLGASRVALRREVAAGLFATAEPAEPVAGVAR